MKTLPRTALPLALASIVFLTPAPCIPRARAQGAAVTPEALVARYFERMIAQDMKTLVEDMHGAELDKFKKMLLPVFEAGFASGDDPGILKAFTRGDTVEQVRAYSSRDFFIRFLEWMIAIRPQMSDILKQSVIQAIGHVSEQTPDGEILHVVFRMTTRTAGMTISKLSVMSLRREGQDWKLMLTGEIEGMAQALQQQLKNRPERARP